MERITYCVYGACLLAACAARWLTLPVRRRLAVLDRGRDGARRTGARLRAGLKDLREQLQKERKDREIYEAISFLRNVTAVGMSGSMSADLALQRLAENRGVLQPAYAKTLGLLRLNKREEAAKKFGEAVGDGLGLDFIRVVLQWDDIDPRELTASLISYQKSLKEMRVTARKKRDELLSDLIYIPVIVNILLIFVNFIFIAYFVEQRDMLRDLFF
ncbi:MAG: hypothetical protein LBE16_08480 [Clostridiales Family XIII bacterium]|jgi:hypothetical protein|nr:hypothetical protein [Clostridiales Family XIII bacterium]